MSTFITRTVTQGAAHSVTMPSLHVIVEQPGGACQRAPLHQRLTVGASDEADITVKTGQTSRQHCELTLTTTGVLLRDQKSKNGTHIGLLRVHEAYLPVGVRVTIGKATLWLEVAGDPINVELSGADHFGDAVGSSWSMRALFQQLRSVSTADTLPVLLLGETGTGKGVIARAIHDESPRHRGPFVVFDGSAIHPDLVNADLFGNEKGSFTGAYQRREGLFAAAHGGTIFLDEVGELAPEVQRKLLRVLEDGTYRRLGSNEEERCDVRVIAATHRNLPKAVEAGYFRQDLYYRLAGKVLTVPPLRDRREDLPHLIARLLEKRGTPAGGFQLPATIMQALMEYSFPGNVRELRNILEQLICLPTAPPDLSTPLRSQASPELGALADLVEMPLDCASHEFERRYLRAVARSCGGDISKVALKIGKSRQHVYRMMETLGIKLKCCSDPD